MLHASDRYARLAAREAGQIALRTVVNGATVNVVEGKEAPARWSVEPGSTASQGPSVTGHT
jgi:hypothetical protein